ncbi:MAG: hypothetical protein HKN76_13955, partial [Saprospiraceae bacterium]|nr:hypothetical protein [Saprospiraceae bacterium]
GEKTVYSEVSTGLNGGGTIYSANDVIELNNSCIPMVFSNTNLNGTQTYTSCEIVADPNVSISGEILFEAPTVILGLDVEVPLGAIFEVQVN